MAILQSALVEPLLSRQQTAVIRDIARAAQLTEALKSIKLMESELFSDPMSLTKTDTTRIISNYLKSEVTRVLMQIKIPAIAIGDTKADTLPPGKVPDGSHSS